MLGNTPSKLFAARLIRNACPCTSLPDELLLRGSGIFVVYIGVYQRRSRHAWSEVSMLPRDQFHSFCTKSVGGLCLLASMC